MDFAKLFSAAEESKPRDKALPDGTHVLAVDTVSVLQSLDHGQFARVQMVLVSSTNDKLRKGEAFGEVYFIEMGKHKKTHQVRLRQMTRAIAKLPDSAEPAQVETAFVQLIDKHTQPGRGMLVRAKAAPRSPKDAPDKTYIATNYESVEQTKEDVKAMRAWVESLGMETAKPAGEAQPAQAPAPQAEASGGGFLAGLNLNRG
jgi:hypothetical protein